MFTTTMAAVTMTGLLASGAFIPGPTWVADYGVALRQAAEQGKPVAVFIADGSKGFAQVLPAGALTPESTKLLNDKYVTVFVDTTTEAGKATAKVFELKEGLVISNRGGAKQALRHNGAVTAESINAYLPRFANVDTVTTTESNIRVSYSSPIGTSPAPAAAPYGAPIVNPYFCPSCQQGRR